VTLSSKPKYLFGPVHSRRLGLSLGIDVVPMKTCTYNCIYCQLGRTKRQTIQRKEYVPTAEVMAELSAYLESGGQADYITFSGSGEPTLHLKLGEMIAQAKQMSAIPVAVLTCGALLLDMRVRHEVAQADVVLPTLNAVSPATIRAINRPHGKLPTDWIIEGLKKFRQEYAGQIWLEIMFVKGFNDNPKEVAQLREVLVEINADKVQLNTVVRPPAETKAQALSEGELKQIAAALGERAEVIIERLDAPRPPARAPLLVEVNELLARHPATLAEIAGYLDSEPETIRAALHSLIETGEVEVRTHHGQEFYVSSSART
jgi:wyosine [tRNA(Phe)-imidazoG37] synthetase (radical SAM superfamily)